jgi:SAM-dependent methyltransferase
VKPLARAFWTAHSHTWDDALADRRVVDHIDAIADWLADALPVGASVVDLGCGTGNYMRALEERGVRVVGVDSSPGMLARAAAKVDRLVRADITSLPLAPRSVDGVLSVYSAQFFDLGAFLAEPARVLKSGGVVLIELPERLGVRPPRRRSLRFEAFQQVKRVVAFAGRHTGRVHLHSPDDVHTALHAAGFAVRDTRTGDNRFTVLASRA